MTTLHQNRDLLLFNKPYGVLCQFTDSSGRETLAGFIDAPGYYPAGRLDRDSEGLLLLTRNGALQQRISHPRFKLTKQYLVQVDGAIDEQAIDRLRCGVSLKDGPARALHVERVSPPDGIWPRDPPVRVRRNIPTSWVRISLQEGRNRQVRRMTAAVNHPTLRLIRTHIGACEVWSLRSGQWRFENQSALFA